MKIPKYRRRSIIPPKGSIPRGKFKKPEFQFVIEPYRDEELESEIREMRKQLEAK